MQNAKTSEKGMSFQLIENTTVLCKDKPRGALPGLGWYYHWYVQISIGNKFWGPLNQKKGGMLHRLRIYHRQRDKSSASQITLVIIKYHSSKEVMYFT
jgi:hypothetical protein